MAQFANVRTVHIVLFVISWLLAIAFLVFMFRPLMRRVATESRQVAELLSQLPPEMDVEGLVAQAMARSGGGGGKGDDDDSGHGREAGRGGGGDGYNRRKGGKGQQAEDSEDEASDIGSDA